MRIYDLSVPIWPGMPVYEGDPPPRLRRTKRLEEGDPFNLALFACSTHTGTHVDAPAHFLKGAATVDQLPLDLLVGPATVVHLEVAQHIQGKDLEAQLSQAPERLILKTRNSELWTAKSFQQDYVALEESAARWLVANGVRLVGIDYLSIEAFGAPDYPVHHLLLGAGIVVVEGLDLRAVPAGDYTLLCLPLRLVGADGAPARVLLLTP